MSSQASILSSIGSRGGRVTAAHVAADTGLGLRQCARELNQLAALSQATLEVSADGGVMYVFAAGLPSVFAANTLKQLATSAGKLLLHLAHFLLRCAFGLLFVASFAIVLCVCIAAFAILACLAVFTGLHDHGDLISLLQMFDLQNLCFYFSWHPRNLKNEECTYLGEPVAEIDSDGLLYNSYSFLFGDGNPNQHFSDECLRNVAALIISNNGAVTWDQVMPLVAKPTVSEESLMFPLLVNLDGLPQVNAAGKLFYVFPELQQVAANSNCQSPPDYVEELPWQFTQEEPDKMTLVVVFGVINLLCWFMISRTPSLLELITPNEWVVPILVAGAAFFFIVPALRQLANVMRNVAIEYRNNARRNAALQFFDGQSTSLDTNSLMVHQ